MKIAWFTPFSRTSAVARFSWLVVNELAKRTEVEIWHPAAEKLRETAVPHHRIDLLNRAGVEKLASYDALVYNIGNHLGGHREIFEMSQRVPGITILHDYVLQNFFANLYLRHSNNRRLYTAAMKRHYGEEGERVALDSVSEIDPIWHSDDVVKYPLFEEAMAGAFGIIVHSEFFRRRVEATYPGPVQKLALPYAPSGSGAPMDRGALGIPPDRALIVTIGDVNANKRTGPVIEAIAKDAALRRRVFYAVVGSTDSQYADLLAGMVKELGMEDTVRFTGHVSDEVLHQYLSHAALCINLRYPSTEGASGSAVEEMINGKPVIVSDTGFYSELPDDCVWKVRAGKEEDEICAALRRLLDDAELRERYGRNARDYAARTFRPDTYAEGVLDLIAESRRARPILALSDAVGGELARMGVTQEMPVVKTASRVAFELFCRRD